MTTLNDPQLPKHPGDVVRQLADLQADLCEAQASCYAYAKKILQLSAALAHYGRHLNSCNTWLCDDDHNRTKGKGCCRCDCGLTALIRANL